MRYGWRLWRAVILAALGVVLAFPPTTMANEVPDLATYVRTLRQELETSRQTIRSLERDLAEQKAVVPLPPPSDSLPSRERRRLEARIVKIEADRDRLAANLAECEKTLNDQVAEMEGLREQLASTEATADETVMLRRQLADLQTAYDTRTAEIDAVTEQLNDHLTQRETLVTALEDLNAAQAHLAESRELITAEREETKALREQLAELQAGQAAFAEDAEQRIVEATRELNASLAQAITELDAAKARTLQAQTERDSIEKDLATLKATAREEGVVRNRQALREQITRTNDTALAWSLNDVGLLLARDGQLDEADALYLRAQQILTDQLGPSHLALGTLLQNRAEVRWQDQDLSEAARFYQQAARMFEETLGPSHPRLAPLLNDWATVLRNLNQLDQAETLYRRSIELYEQAPDRQPLALATPLHNLAVVLQAGNQREEAGLMLARAWSVLEPVREQHAGPAIVILRSLRDHYRLLGDADRALEYEEKANQLAVTWLAP